LATPIGVTHAIDVHDELVPSLGQRNEFKQLCCFELLRHKELVTEEQLDKVSMLIVASWEPLSQLW
jgi:hypothetical protein